MLICIPNRLLDTQHNRANILVSHQASGLCNSPNFKPSQAKHLSHNMKENIGRTEGLLNAMSNRAFSHAIGINCVEG